jgi:branched-chain amino acid transport system ATP-binding protein
MIHAETIREDSKSAASDAFLEICSLTRFFGGLAAVNDVSFSVRQNSITAIIGPNGAGKTTLFNLISGSLRCNSGAVTFKGAPVHNREPHEIAGRGISRTFQNIKLFSRMTVLENVMVGRHTRARAGYLAAALNLPWTWREEREIRTASMDILGMLGIAEHATQEATSLPFGKQRLCELARALASEPEIILLDEPAAGLNIHETEEMSRRISAIRETGITILLIEHDMSLVMDISDDIVVLSSGRKIAEGDPRSIQRNSEVIRVYLGDDHA